MQDEPGKSLPPLRSQIALLAVACAAPVLLALALLLVYFQQRDQGRAELDFQRRARATAAIVDRQLLAAEASALALASSPHARNGDLAALRSQVASALLPALPYHSHILLTDNNTPQVVAGEALPLDRVANLARLKFSHGARSAASVLPSRSRRRASRRC